MNFKLHTLLGAGCLAVGLLIAQPNASAVPITGAVNFTGSGFTTQMGNTTSVNFNNPFSVNGGTGSYAGTPGSSATFTNFSFTGSGNTNNAMLVGGTIMNEWSFNFGGRTYSFDLAALDSANSTANERSISLQGTGTLRITGSGPTYDPTAGSFALSGAGNNFQFTFLNATSSAAVPDGGSVVALLGVALVGIEALRRKLSVQATA